MHLLFVYQTCLFLEAYVSIVRQSILLKSYAKLKLMKQQREWDQVEKNRLGHFEAVTYQREHPKNVMGKIQMFGGVWCRITLTTFTPLCHGE